MRRSVSVFVAAAGVLAGAPASADFHLWELTEVYTNADQSVQFVEFFTPESGQQFLLEQNLVSSVGGTAQETYTFPTNLTIPQGQSTANRHFLFASPEFEAAAGIAPDFVWTGISSFIPYQVVDAVVLIGAGGISLANLPTDGVLSLLADGVTTAVPSPTNFAGETGTIVPEPAPSALGVALVATLGGAARLSRSGARPTR